MIINNINNTKTIAAPEIPELQHIKILPPFLSFHSILWIFYKYVNIILNFNFEFAKILGVWWFTSYIFRKERLFMPNKKAEKNSKGKKNSAKIILQ